MDGEILARLGNGTSGRGGHAAVLRHGGLPLSAIRRKGRESIPGAPRDLFREDSRHRSADQTCERNRAGFRGAAGSVPHIYTKGATAYYSRAGWSVGGGGVGQAGGCAARRQGVGIGCAPLPGRRGDAGGALSPKAPRKMRPAWISEPYQGSNGVRRAGGSPRRIRGWLGILRGWECGLLDGASS